ncbi:hypothetical protein FNJ84_12885 [Paracoccus sp. M683]|uniref:hypothetical protein n=1 Tax=Paracoccus sp. M683 TaxID=2594268 RepID=UPI00117C7A06|nr:hypothetical protein [Paracoccus sp. M683]TRW96187.1 hypothetical protein FNJ84_12885 [Paracoccus sp. M683]
MTDKPNTPDAVHRYQCPACGHRMTYGHKRCGACNEEAPVYNLPNFWLGLYASTAVAAAAVIYALL